MADELPPLIATLKGDASDLFSTLSEVESALEAFAGKDYMAQLGLDTAQALTELAAFESVADSQTITIPVTLDTSGAIAQLALLQSGAAMPGGSGGAGLGAALGGTAGSGGGGSGAAGLLAALGFGKGASRGIPGLGAFGAGLAGFGSIGAMAGLGPESLLTTLLGIGGSGLGALAGGGALAAGAVGVGAVGMGTDLAGIGQASGDIKTTYTNLQALDASIQQFGPHSTQAAAAFATLNQGLTQFSPLARGAVLAAAQTAVGFRALFDQVTGAAEATGANIINQVMQVAEKFLPTIGQFAAQNMLIIQTSLQPLFTWLQGPGLQIFTELETIFQQHLPAAMQAFTQGIELVIKTLGFLAPMTGHFITFLDDLFTKLNSPEGFYKFSAAIQSAVDIFHVWEGLIKAVGTAIYELFHHDAGTGTAIIQSLTDMVNKFNDWAKTVAGGDKLHSLLEAHKNEILSLLSLLPHIISIFGQLELTVSPTLMTIVADLAKLTDALLKVPFVGQVAGWILAFGILYNKIGLISTIFGPVIKLLMSLGGVLVATVFPAFTEAAGGAAGFSAALDANPVGVIVIALAALGVGLYELVKHFDAVSHFLNGPWGTAISAAVAGVFPMIGLPMLIIGHWRGFVNFFTHDIPNAFHVVENAVGVFVGFFTAIPGEVNHVWSDVVSELHSAWSSVSNWVSSNVTQPIVSFFTAIPGIIDHIWSDVVSAIHAAWSAIANWVNANIIQPIVNFFKGVPGAIAGAIAAVAGIVEAPFSAAWGIVSPILNNITSFFGGLAGAVSKAVSTIGGTLAAPFQAAWAIIGPILSAIQGAINLISNSKPAGSYGTPGAGGNTSGGSSVPLRAAGGPVSSGQPYLVGENGPELFLSGYSGAIVPINMGSPIAPIAATNAGGAGNATITVQQPVQVVLNNQVIGQTMQTLLLKMARSQGNLWGGWGGTNQTGSATNINSNAVAR